MDGKINFLLHKTYQMNVLTYPHIYSLYHSQNSKCFSVVLVLIFGRSVLVKVAYKNRV